LVGGNVYVHGVNDTGLLLGVKRNSHFFLRFVHFNGGQPAGEAIGTPPPGAHAAAIKIETRAPEG